MALTNFDSLADSSRVWIYRANRKFSTQEEKDIELQLNQFITSWTAHSHSLLALGKIYHSQFIVIFLDEESSTQASGCSIDTQVRFIKDVGASLNIDFFDRLHFDFVNDDNVLTIHQHEIKKQFGLGVIDEQTLVFDHLVKNKKQFLDSWTKPFQQSWHFRVV